MDLKESVLGLVRHALTTLGGFLAAQGTIEASEVELAVGAIVTLIGVVWSVLAKRKAA